MDEINLLKTKVRDFYSLKDNTNKKIEELDKSFSSNQNLLENESTEKREQLKTEYEEKLKQLKLKFEENIANVKKEYENRLKNLKNECDKNKNDALTKLKEEKENIIKLSLEAYKKALFDEFDRKRSTERYDPKESGPLNALKEILENNDFLPKENLEKINDLFSGKISIDELMYEQT
ncbi:MAG: hypothetical protein ACTSO9_02870 [Candidatus Helarchaeota archaeon]